MTHRYWKLFKYSLDKVPATTTARLWAFFIAICLSPLHSRFFLSSIIPSSVLLVPIYPVITLLLAFLAPAHLLASLTVHVLCGKKTPAPSFALTCPLSSQPASSTRAPGASWCIASVPGAALGHLCSPGIMETHLQNIISTPHLRNLQWLKGSFPMWYLKGFFPQWYLKAQINRACFFFPTVSELDIFYE